MKPQTKQAIAFIILLLMAATETEYISFYVVCTLVALALIINSKIQTNK